MGAGSALIFSVIVNAAILLIFLRFLTQLAMVSPYNPVVLVTIQSTRFVDMFSRIFPTLAKGRVNVAAIVLLMILFLFKVWGYSHFGKGIEIFNEKYVNLSSSIVGLLLGTFMSVTESVILFCRYLIFASIILSWVVMLTQTRSPYIEVVQELAEPLLAPFRKILPNMGMIDLSPIVAFLALNLIEMVMRQISMALLATF